ncbi:MAG: transglutaminase-like domain-containing protein [Bacteroidetes bacterium]|nr:transglutaminase-like domain-containing protein [Bacteroidota bacterium]
MNNENLDSFRTVVYPELKQRVKGMSLHDAALEVNHWCHEKVTYRGSDSRTSSPLATIRTSYGRCGEESTFTVAALRAVGIPARQGIIWVPASLIPS